jgi:hypothetical protein
MVRATARCYRSAWRGTITCLTSTRRAAARGIARRTLSGARSVPPARTAIKTIAGGRADQADEGQQEGGHREQSREWCGDAGEEEETQDSIAGSESSRDPHRHYVRHVRTCLGSLARWLSISLVASPGSRVRTTESALRKSFIDIMCIIGHISGLAERGLVGPDVCACGWRSAPPGRRRRPGGPLSVGWSRVWGGVRFGDAPQWTVGIRPTWDRLSERHPDAHLISPQKECGSMWGAGERDVAMPPAWA